jgi:diacylglycerol kinase (ATP)
MLNKPKYSLFSNTKYALNGLLDLVKNETSFKLEIFVLFISIPVIIFIDKSMIEKLFLFSSIIFILVTEAINGAIERVVDLVSPEYNTLAGKAKDAGSAAVFIAVSLAVVVWGVILW